MIAETSNRTVIKADPGWYIVLYWHDTDEEEGETDGILCSPIVAWVAEEVQRLKDKTYFHSISPLTVEGDVDSEKYCIKTPDGQCIFPFDRFCTDEREALQHFRDMKARDHFQRIHDMSRKLEHAISA